MANTREACGLASRLGHASRRRECLRVGERTMRNFFVILLVVSSGGLGCREKQKEQASFKPPEVLVSYPLRREVIDYAEFTGRTEAARTVEVRARATGYLEKVLFQDGALVDKDQELFEIDPRPYRAELNKAEAGLVMGRAHLERLETDYQRVLAAMRKKASTPEEFDKVSGDRAEAKASLEVAKANWDLAKLHLDFTTVKAPIAGRISRRFKDPGNLIKADDTLLTTIVSLDPMYVYFEVDERTERRLRSLLEESGVRGDVKAGNGGQKSEGNKSDADPSLKKSDLDEKEAKGIAPFYMGLADEEGYPHKGEIHFVDNRVDPGTGTLQIRGVVKNPKNLLAPGLFARVWLPIGQKYSALMVAERSLITDQGQKFLYVLNGQDEVVYRPVKVGRGQVPALGPKGDVLGALRDGLRVIEEGLAEGDRIIVSGLQRARPNAKITPKLVDMPVQK